MNLYLRFFWVFITSFFRDKLLSPLALSRLIFRVLPNDLDLNGHMNNGRYLTLMDLGRLDLVLRTGLLSHMMKQKSVPVLASAKIRYRLPLMPFEKFTLDTRIIGWDEKWAYLEQRFIKTTGDKAGAVAAIAMVKGSFFDNRSKKTIPTSEIMHILNWTEPSPPLPDHVLKWQEAEESVRELTKN
jgi:acyl-CoA thioesterase FadM